MMNPATSIEPVKPIAESAPGESTNVLADLLYYRLFSEAEQVRWRMEDIPWSSIDRSCVTPAVLEVVRQLALAELTTYTATRRFLQEFSDDIDFTQWMSVWFYEETKHPYALMRWMREVGEKVSGGEMVRGRITAPFMKSRFGMLVTNVISEVHASALYVAIATTTKEPVLKRIATTIAGDEARHATGFLAYARRVLERAKRPEEYQLEALKVLHMWLNQNGSVQHPVNTVGLRTAHEQELLQEFSRAMTDERMLDQQSVIQQRLTRERALGLVSNLIGVEVKSEEDVVARVRELRTSMHDTSRN
jgi:hypothetical protein